MRVLKNFIVVTGYTIIALLSSCVSVSETIHSEDVLVWEPDIAVFDSLNRIEVSDEQTLMVTGSSSIRLWDSIHSDLAPYKVLQRGYGGAKLSDFNYYAERIIKPQTYKAILLFIANDISGSTGDRTPGEVFKLYKILIGQIRERNPGTPVFWIAVTPTPSRWHAFGQINKAGEKIRRYCDRYPDLYFIVTEDIFINEEGVPDPRFFKNDMLHLNREGYRHWSERILQVLQEQGVVP
ncbi:MAG TPA: hypothetical protein ENN61_05090 [Bacteroidaceae bacterium]|nr:hypothetical protein [Bacteroidaceae bacterium]